MTDDELTEQMEVAYRLLRKLARRWGVRATEEELRDITAMAVAVALVDYNPQAGKFETWVYYQLLDELRMHVRREVKHSRISYSDDVRITGTVPDAESLYIINESLDRLVRGFRAKGQRVFFRLLSGLIPDAPRLCRLKRLITNCLTETR